MRGELRQAPLKMCSRNGSVRVRADRAPPRCRIVLQIRPFRLEHEKIPWTCRILSERVQAIRNLG